jgi:hypothetical protein
LVCLIIYRTPSTIRIRFSSMILLLRLRK